jgi:deazaflavin-dependent oxidoreductase (nitroreductase family)
MRIDPFTRMFARWASEAHIFMYRLTGGAGPFDRNICILSTRGRKSGHIISRPLWYYERDGRIHLIASFGGSDRAPGWYLNLVANPSVEIEVGRSRKRARARTLSDDEAEKLWPEILAHNPIYGFYRKRTSRKIPIVEVAAE